MNIVNISLSKIVPDENQPRKYFDEAKMGSLKDSIKNHGIKNPLLLEIQQNGMYLLIDGERRYRAAKQLGLKEVPALLQPQSNVVQRLIEQFHVQEQHEGWTVTEKAMAVSNLAEQMNTTIAEIGKILSIPETSLRNYIAFSKILDKSKFEKTRLPIKYSGSINAMKLYAKKVSLANDLEFNRNTEKAVENAIYTRVNNGEEINTSFFSKIRDSIKQQPHLLEEFIENDELTVDKLFRKSKAKGALQLRQMINNAHYLYSGIHNFMKEPSTKVEKQVITNLKLAQGAITKFIEEFETLEN